MMVSAVAATPHDDDDDGGDAAATLPLLPLLAPLALSLDKR